ncbi:hypothetical protein D3C73_1138650 [compost metagenome]
MPRTLTCGAGRSSMPSIVAPPFPGPRNRDWWAAFCRRRRPATSACSPITFRRSSTGSPTPTRTWCMALVMARRTTIRWCCRYRISAIASGCMRCMTRAAKSSPNWASNTAPNPATTWWSGRTGRVPCPQASPRSSRRLPNWSPLARGHFSTTVSKTARRSSRSSTRWWCIH